MPVHASQADGVESHRGHWFDLEQWGIEHIVFMATNLDLGQDPNYFLFCYFETRSNYSPLTGPELTV